MSGPGRPTLCKPEHAGRARALCARGAANPDRAGHRERILLVRQQNGRRKGRNFESLGNTGLFNVGAKRRKPTETGGNPLQKLWNWRFTCGNSLGWLPDERLWL